MIEHKDGSITRIEFKDFGHEGPYGEGWLRLTWENIDNQRFGYHTEEAMRSRQSWEKYANENPYDVQVPYARIVQVAEPIFERTIPEDISPYFDNEIPF